MSKELTGQNFQLVGSNDYFMALNKAHSIHRILPFSDPKDYSGALKALCIRINDIFEEVYSDLQKYERFMRYIPQADRMNLVKIVLGLRDICVFARYSTGKSEKCIDILKLDTYGTRTVSKASDREIDEAVKEVLDGRHTDLSKYDRIDFIKKAMEYNLNDIIEKDERARAYFNLFPSYDSKDFFTDIWNNLYFLDSYNHFRGKCGKEICSKDYFDYIEKEIFYQDMPNYYLGPLGDRFYKDFIVNALQSIVNDINYDLEQGLKDNDYILDISAQNICFVCKQLEQYGISCSSIEKTSHELAWFCGGDPAQILLLQQKLNQLGFCGSKGKLLEDGVYGKETVFAIDEFSSLLERSSMSSAIFYDDVQKIVDANNIHEYSSLDNAPQKLDKAFSNIDKSTLKQFRRLANSLDEFLGVFAKIIDVSKLLVTIEKDLQDADKKIGKKTYSAVAEIATNAISGYVSLQIGAGIGMAIGGAPGAILGAIVGYYWDLSFSHLLEQMLLNIIDEIFPENT